MKNSLKPYLLAFFLFSNIAIFAQPPGDTGDPEGPEAPINSMLIWLAMAGIAFAFYYFNNKKAKLQA